MALAAPLSHTVRSLGTLACAAMLVVSPLRPARAQACPAAGGGGQELGLVLSGGGARGLAHIGVLRVLDSLGIRPSIVAGTSMGALVGALYSGGMSGQAIDSLARELPFEALFSRYQPTTLLTAGDLRTPVAQLHPGFVLEVREGDVRLQSPVAREQQVNALLNRLLLQANLIAAGDFDRLPHRFRAVATDVESRSAVTLARGDLAEAVRASIAIPLVFAPVERDGRFLLDGGLADNAPVTAARAAGATRIIVSDVGPFVGDSVDATTTADMVEYLIDELFLQPPDSLGASDVRLRPDVRDVNPLAFTDEAVGPLILHGYRAAQRAFAGCTPAPRAPAAPPAADVVSALSIATQLERLADEGTYETVWLHPRRTAEEGRLVLAPIAVPSPDRVIYGGASYDSYEGGRAWLASNNLSPAGGRLRLGSALSLTEWEQQAVLFASAQPRPTMPRVEDGGGSDPLERVRLPDPRTDVPPWSKQVRDLLRAELSLTASREIVRTYDSRGRELDRPSARNLVAFAGGGVAPDVGQRLVLGPVAHLWDVRSGTMPDRTGTRAFGGLLRAMHSFDPPDEGPYVNSRPMEAGEVMWLDRYWRASIGADLPARTGHLYTRTRLAGGWGERLPLPALFTLGGSQGFPGMRPGERRGTRVVEASVEVLRQLVGPLYARADVGLGYTSMDLADDRALDDRIGRGRVAGGEIGLMVDTPLGAIVISYGSASTGRPVLRIRVGD